VFRRNLLHPSSEYINAGDINSCVSETSAYIQQSTRLVSQNTVLLKTINYINPVVLLWRATAPLSAHPTLKCQSIFHSLCHSDLRYFHLVQMYKSVKLINNTRTNSSLHFVE